MYEEFYHFKENPFNVTSDPVFFFLSSCHSQAFSHLTYGIEHRKGILLITGEVGTGKTTLCRTLLDKYRNHKEYNVKTALILNPSFLDQQLLQLILRDFGIPGDFKNKFDLVNALNKFLLEETGKGNNIVLIIDEAQNLGVEELEQIRLLSNLETEKEKLLQIILIGQPELCEKLELTSLRQLNQRITVRYHLLPLKREEIEKYINHRLRIASSKRSDNSVRFTNNAIDAIYESCKGTPRMVNIICERALLAGYTLETFIIDTKIINRCIKEVDIKISGRQHRVQSLQKNSQSEKLIVDSTIKRKVWYKNIYVLILIFFAVAGMLYAVLDFYGLTTLLKPSGQKLSVLSNATVIPGLPKQKSVVPQKSSDKSVLPTQKKELSARFGPLKPASGHAETVAEKYTKGSSFYGQEEYKEAAVWYRKAAEQGHAQAQSNLGIMYSQGQGVEKDYNEAVKWCRKAAEQGNEQAQGMLGVMYSKGHGVEKDYNEAVKWCRKAADQGNEQAQSMLGVMYSKGRGVEQDYKEAVNWYRKAAEQWNGQAQAILGVMYSRGQGVERDTEEAVKWYKKASEQGIGYAKEALKRLELDQE
ncbi:MAG: AAA family ATPase [Candidatus Scalindua sp.]|nr:AAA family ATPase [Candidatus Scalindua sp.]